MRKKKITPEEEIRVKETLKQVEEIQKDKDKPTTDKSLVLVDDYSRQIGNLKNVSKADYLPTQASFHYGCFDCEWRGTFRCPYGFKVGKGHSTRKNSHANGICELRKVWLMSLYQGKKNKPTYKEWLRDFHKAIGNRQFKKDERRLEIIDEKLRELRNSGAEQEEIDKYELARAQAHDDFLNIWKEIRKLEEREADREAAVKMKQKEIREQVLTLQGIRQVMSIKPKKIIEVNEKGEVIEDGSI